MDHYSNSYQNAPQIKHLDATAAAAAAIPQPYVYYGDATLQPNTGLTNSYDYALFGLALHQLLNRLRYAIMISSVGLLLVIFFTWWARLVRPVGLLLTLVLAVLVVVLLVVEVSSLTRAPLPNAVEQQQQQQQQQRHKFMELMEQTEQIGLVILFHPVGKTCYLILCAVLCWWVGGGWEVVVGISFAMEAAVLLYCWITYPEFRRTFDNNHNNPDTPRSVVTTAASSMKWSYFYTASPQRGGVSPAAAGSEGASLLQQAGHAFGM